MNDLNSINPFEKCPVVETKSFIIRLIEKSDSKDLFNCYHDEKALAFMNDDNCDFSFYMETEDKMAETVDYWLDFYKKGYFIRFSIVERNTGRIIGTIEGFNGEVGVLRMDITSKDEKADIIIEILDFATKNFKAYFGNSKLVTKAIPSATQRQKALKMCGWKFIGKYRDYNDYFEIIL